MTSSDHLHIFGVARDSSDLQGIHSPKLKRAYLRLIITVERLRACGKNAVGYLSFASQQLSELAAATWSPIYGDYPHVSIIPQAPMNLNLEDLLENSRRRETAILMQDRTHQMSHNIDWDDLLMPPCLQLLHSHIRHNHPGVQPLTQPSQGIAWDFYGIVEPQSESPTQVFAPLYS